MFSYVTDRSSILADMRNLQISPGRNPIRQKHRIMKKLVCQESSEFRPVWEEESQGAIYYESNRIYFNNYRKCYTSLGCSGKPELLYSLPQCPKSQKIEDALVCEFNTSRVSTSSEDYRAHLIALSRDNYLSLLDLDTGRTTKKVFLSNEYKFRSLAWNGAGESFFVKANVRSILNTAAPFITFIVFETFPLRLHSHLAVTKQVFKKSIVDSFIFQGLLIVLHTGNRVRLFSYDRIIQEHTAKILSLEDIGSDGVPLTVELNAMPPILFELRCNEHNLWLGGVPLHYLYQPQNQDHYIVCQMKTEQVVKNGSIPVSLDAYETDTLHFMADDSNRLVHVTVSAAKILKINMLDDGTSRIDELFRIQPHEGGAVNGDGSRGPSQTWLMSCSGRIIRRSTLLDDSIGIDPSRIYSIQYDNELNIIVATSLSAEQHLDGGINAFVCFHDEYTGKKLKTIELESWDDTYDHTLALDLDTLVHIYKDNRAYHCVLYRLDRSTDEGVEEKLPKR